MSERSGRNFFSTPVFNGGTITGRLTVPGITTSTGSLPGTAALSFGGTTGTPFIYSDNATFVAVNDGNGIALQINGSSNQFIVYKQLLAGSLTFPITAGGATGQSGIMMNGPGVENLGILWTASTKTLSFLNAVNPATSTWIADTGIKLGIPIIQLGDFGAAPASATTAGTQGEIVQHSGILYFCSVTGAAGAATWNKVNLTVV